MSELDDLTAKLSDIEAKTSGLDSAQRQLLDKLQNGLERAHEALVGKKAEIARLSEENRRLRAITDRLLAAIESRAEAGFTDQLQDLDGRLAALLALSEDEAGRETTDETSSDDPGTAANRTDEGERTPESLSDIESRVERMLAEMGLEAEPEETPESDKTEVSEASPNTEPDEVPDEPEPERAPEAEVRANRSRRPAKSASASYRADPTSPRLPYSSEVDYALGILRQMKRGDQTFSVDDVRELINGKFNLGLTESHDRHILSNLGKRRSVAPAAKNRNAWKFVQVA